MNNELNKLRELFKRMSDDFGDGYIDPDAMGIVFHPDDDLERRNKAIEKWLGPNPSPFNPIYSGKKSTVYFLIEDGKIVGWIFQNVTEKQEVIDL